jgi:sigma-B regulation protein RsbQ
MSNSEILKKHNVKIIGNHQADQVLLFVHGFGSNQLSWRFLIPAFEEDYLIILFDLAGFGASKIKESEYLHYESFASYAQDLLEICHELEIKNITVISHSMGSMVSTLAVLKEPDLFAKLIFIGASPRYLNEGDYQGGFTESDVVKILGEISKNYTHWVNHYSPIIMSSQQVPTLNEEFSQCLMKLRPDFSLLIFSMILSSDHRAKVAKLTLPVLIIQSEDDPFVPASVGDYLHQVIKNSQICWVKAKGHFPHMTGPGQVILAITEFMAVGNIMGN